MKQGEGIAKAILFADGAAFDLWLREHHDSANKIWLKLAKKAAVVQTLNYAQALDIALCHGWIDGIKKPLTDVHFLQRFTPRQKNSPWSVINRNKVAALQKAGRMQQGGLEAVAQAKLSGMWDKAYAGSSSIEVPSDFTAALNSAPKAKAFFEQLNRQNRYSILYRIGAVKKPETRARKIVQFVAMLEKGEKLYP